MKPDDIILIGLWKLSLENNPEQCFVALQVNFNPSGFLRRQFGWLEGVGKERECFLVHYCDVSDVICLLRNGKISWVAELTWGNSISVSAGPLQYFSLQKELRTASIHLFRQTTTMACASLIKPCKLFADLRALSVPNVCLICCSFFR